MARKAIRDSQKNKQNEDHIQKAFHHLSLACNKDGQMSQAFSLRGQCYNQMGDFQRALFDFSIAIRIAREKDEDPKTLSEYYNYAGVQHYELGQLEEALNHYNLAVNNYQQDGQYFYNRALVKSRLDKVEEAIQDYKKAIDLLGTSEQDSRYQAFFNRGICFRRIGNLERSIDDFKEAIKMRNDKPSAHNNLGLSYFENEEFEEALIHYGKAIGIEPSSVHYNNRGLAYYHFDKLEEAKQDFDLAIEKDPNDPTIYFNRGNVFLNWKPEQQFDLAHQDYDTAISIDPNNAKLWHSKGLAFQGKAELVYKRSERQDLHLIDLAIEMYQKALSI
mmetsp:Transcript_6828/g.11526  ORF Transcript_6828/g.11526 Transcript_6828/m.11526 type:complete len:332 (+) Transcript_6828:127-1122(+)